MEIVLKKRNTGKTAPQRAAVPSPAYASRYGAWGRVDKVHSGDHSADIVLDSGMYITNVPVASQEWVVPGEEYTSGERSLPPIDARVFVFMPYGSYDGCFVLCSGFIVTDKAQKEAFMEDDKEKIRKRVFPGNWKGEYHYATGTCELISPDEKSSLKIDYGTEQDPKDPSELHLNIFENVKADIIGDDNVKVSVFDEVKVEHVKEDYVAISVFDEVAMEHVKEDHVAIYAFDELSLEHIKGNSVAISVFDELSLEHIKEDHVAISVFDEVSIEHAKGDSCTVKVFDTELVIKAGEVSIKTKKTTIEADGDAKISVTGKADVEVSGNATVKSPKVQVTGGQLLVNGTAAPSSGPFCAVPACIASGAPHTGSLVSGT